MELLAVSTSWRSDKITGAKELVDAVKETGVNALELEFRLSPSAFGEIEKRRREWGVDVVSLHAVCPAPDGRKGGAEAFLISDEDEERRRKGVADVVRTLENASRIGARAVVVHCGMVRMEEPIHAMMKFYDGGAIASEAARKYMDERMLERAPKARKSMEMLLKSLGEINDAAERLKVDVGLENRYYFRELPNIEEFGVIFGRLGGRLGYWHDTGHAHVQEKLFGVSHEVMLETFADRLIGVHLHDAKNGYTDHNEPGCGELDFDMVKRFLKLDTIRVMELNHRVSAEEARRGVAFLREKGIFPAF